MGVKFYDKVIEFVFAAVHVQQRTFNAAQRCADRYQRKRRGIQRFNIALSGEVVFKDTGRKNIRKRRLRVAALNLYRFDRNTFQAIRNVFAVERYFFVHRFR